MHRKKQGAELQASSTAQISSHLLVPAPRRKMQSLSRLKTKRRKLVEKRPWVLSPEGLRAQEVACHPGNIVTMDQLTATVSHGCRALCPLFQRPLMVNWERRQASMLSQIRT